MLTEAARLTRPVLTRDDTASTRERPVWVESGEREQADWAEFVTQALAGAAANIGSIEAVLAGRPGSWKADYVRTMLTSTVGHDEARLLEHCTEPLTVQVIVDEILVDLGAWKPTTTRSARSPLATTRSASPPPAPRRAQRCGSPAPTSSSARPTSSQTSRSGWSSSASRDWAAYGKALKANVEAAAGRLERLRVPVVVTVDLQTFRRAEDPQGDSWGLADRVLDQAVQVTPLPGDGRPSAGAAVMTQPARSARRGMQVLGGYPSLDEHDDATAVVDGVDHPALPVPIAGVPAPLREQPRTPAGRA